MIINQGNGRTLQDVAKAFEANNQFGRVVETPVVKSEVNPVKNNDAQVKKYLRNLKGQRAVALVVSSFATILTIGVVASIVEDTIPTKDACEYCSPLDNGHNYYYSTPIRLY